MLGQAVGAQRLQSPLGTDEERLGAGYAELRVAEAPAEQRLARAGLGGRGPAGPGTRALRSASQPRPPALYAASAGRGRPRRRAPAPIGPGAGSPPAPPACRPASPRPRALPAEGGPTPCTPGGGGGGVTNALARTAPSLTIQPVGPSDGTGNRPATAPPPASAGQGGAVSAPLPPARGKEGAPPPGLRVSFLLCLLCPDWGGGRGRWALLSWAAGRRPDLAQSRVCRMFSHR